MSQFVSLSDVTNDWIIVFATSVINSSDNFFLVTSTYEILLEHVPKSFQNKDNWLLICSFSEFKSSKRHEGLLKINTNE